MRIICLFDGTFEWILDLYKYVHVLYNNEYSCYFSRHNLLYCAIVSAFVFSLFGAIASSSSLFFFIIVGVVTEQWKTNSPDLKDFIILLCQQQQLRLVNYILLMSINVQVTVMNTHWTSMLIQKENPKDCCHIVFLWFALLCLALLFALLFIHIQCVCAYVFVYFFHFIIVIISKFEMFENPLAASTSLRAMTM